MVDNIFVLAVYMYNNDNRIIHHFGVFTCLKRSNWPGKLFTIIYMIALFYNLHLFVNLKWSWQRTFYKPDSHKCADTDKSHAPCFYTAIHIRRVAICEIVSNCVNRPFNTEWIAISCYRGCSCSIEKLLLTISHSSMVLTWLRVQNEQFLEEIWFILRDTEKKV